MSDEVYNTILSRRSIRRFKQKPIEIKTLKKFVNAARLAPSAANLQPLRFVIVNEKKVCDQIFKTLSWAGYIKPKWSPDEKERPVAYIIILSTDIKNQWYIRDVSFAAGSIVLAAEEQNIGSCILLKIDRDEIRKILAIPDNLYIDSVIALGYKAENPVVEDLKDTVKYWRDENGTLHVPKRKIEDILHINSYK